MNEDFVKISTNWELAHGKIVDTLITKIVDVDSLDETANSDLTDIASIDRSVHLNEILINGNENNEAHKCEINLTVFPRYLANKITLISDCQKMEIFLNIQDEYYKTVHGELVDDFDGTKVYRFDIMFNEKLCCVKILLKLIPKAPDIWIYGIQLELHENPNPFQPFISQSNINLENVQNMLVNCNHKLSPGAERCKSFLENYMKGSSSVENKSNTANQGYSGFLNSSTFQSFLQGKTDFKLPAEMNLQSNHLINSQNLNLINNLQNESISFNAEYLGNNELLNLKEFFVKKIVESENRIIQRLEQIEQSQDEKLNKILKLLEK